MLSQPERIIIKYNTVPDSKMVGFCLLVLFTLIHSSVTTPKKSATSSLGYTNQEGRSIREDLQAQLPQDPPIKSSRDKQLCFGQCDYMWDFPCDQQCVSFRKACKEWNCRENGRPAWDFEHARVLAIQASIRCLSIVVR